MPDYIEWYLVELEQDLVRRRVPRQKRTELISEVRDHIESASTELEEEGLTPSEAKRTAINVMGSVRAVGAEVSGALIKADWRKTLKWSLLPGAFLLPFAWFLFTQPLGVADYDSSWPGFGLELATAYFALVGIALLVALIKTRGWVSIPLCLGVLFITGANLVRIDSVSDIYAWRTDNGEVRHKLVRAELIEEERNLAWAERSKMSLIVNDMEIWRLQFAHGLPSQQKPDTTELQLLVQGDMWVAPKYHVNSDSYKWMRADEIRPNARNEGAWFIGYSTYEDASRQWKANGGSHMSGAKRALSEQDNAFAALMGESLGIAEKWSFLWRYNRDLPQYIIALLLSLNLVFVFAFYGIERLLTRQRKPVLA